MMSGENASIVFGFFRRKIRDQDAVGASGRGGGRELFEAHLQDRIVVAEKDERDLRGFADTADEIKGAGQCWASFQGGPRTALGRGAIGKRLPKRDGGVQNRRPRVRGGRG